MATYKEIRGTTIQVVDSASSQLGEIFYDSSGRAMKAVNLGAAAWSTGGNLSTAKGNTAGAGTKVAGILFGGNSDTSGTKTNTTEEYDGSSWANGGTMGTARYMHAGTGTQTASLAFGGYVSSNTNATEEYDGSSWTAGGNMSNTTRSRARGGTQTAGFSFWRFT
jgi:hypothetical protein